MHLFVTNGWKSPKKRLRCSPPHVATAASTVALFVTTNTIFLRSSSITATISSTVALFYCHNQHHFLSFLFYHYQFHSVFNFIPLPLLSAVTVLPPLPFSTATPFTTVAELPPLLFSTVTPFATVALLQPWPFHQSLHFHFHLLSYTTNATVAT